MTTEERFGRTGTSKVGSLRPSEESFVINAVSRTVREPTKEIPAMPTSRVQLALNVTDVSAATRFYTDLFGVGPAKERTGYANFEVADPPLKLVLFEHPDAASPLNHLGVELASTEDVAAAARRFESAGLRHSFAAADRCCHAVQDKVWVDAPDVPLRGWEFYTVLADDPDQDRELAGGVCCGGGPTVDCCAGVAGADPVPGGGGR